MSVCEWARLKVCSLVRTILRPQNPGREQGLTCRWQHGKRNSSRRFLCRSYFWKKKPLTFSLNILCIIHDSFLQLQLILIQDFSAGSYYFINTVFFQLQTIELYRYLALVFEMLVNFRVLHWLLDPGFMYCGLSPWFYL